MSSLPLRVLLLLALALAGCAGPRPARPLHPSLQGGDLAPLVAVEWLFYPPGKTSGYKISPDGARIAWIAEHLGRFTIHFRAIGEQAVTRIQARGWQIGDFRWAQDSRHFLVYAPSQGKENYRLYAFDSREPMGDPLEITHFDGFMTSEKQASLHTLPLDDPEHVFVLMNDRDSDCFDYCRVGLTHREKQVVAANPGDVVEWIADRNGRLVARERRDGENGRRSLQVYAPGTDTWEERATFALEDDFRSLAVDDGGRALWALSNRQRDKLALVRLDLTTGQEEVVYAHPEVDVSWVYISESGSQVLGVTVDPDYPEFIFLDEGLQAACAPVRTAMDHAGLRGLQIVSADLAERRLVLKAYSATQCAYYLLDLERQELELLELRIGEGRAAGLAETRPMAFASRDGLSLKGYLTLPQGAPPKGLPMVLLVHGGPWQRDFYGFDPEVQFLANRGYAVLQVNFRGSSGYGRTFMDAAQGEFGGRMQDDLIDALEWAVAEGVADRSRVAIMGASYGGYAALAGLTLTPYIFACGIDSFGPSDLVRLSESRPRSWIWKKFLGDSRKTAARDRMRAKSPLFHADRVVRPVLIVYGAEDQRVDLEQSTLMIEALQKAGKKVEFHSFPDEGHWIVRRENELTHYRLIEDFLARHLGGRQAP